MNSTALILAGIAAAAVVTVIIVMVSLSSKQDGDTDYGWKSPAMAFADGTEMSGSAVADSMQGFEGFEVEFVVVTKDGVRTVYNYDGSSFLPGYDRNTAVTSDGYINPNGVFRIEAKPDADGRIRHVLISQK